MDGSCLADLDDIKESTAFGNLVSKLLIKLAEEKSPFAITGMQDESSLLISGNISQCGNTSYFSFGVRACTVIPEILQLEHNLIKSKV